MLGFEITITSVNAIPPFHLDYRAGIDASSWLVDLLYKKKVENIGDAHGYPFKFYLPWSWVVEGLTSTKAAQSGGVVISDDGTVTMTGYHDGFVFDPKQYPDDQQMFVEMWDMS
ncbi:hypothetical protein [Alteromonas facilis]|uniref:hypothetical protein n=1 Tax=Alteromonas facilis TaxID=2048004 RepID=UPI000C281874|nr:hypothetical protein [Alteromonas facilis]